MFLKESQRKHAQFGAFRIIITEKDAVEAQFSHAVDFNGVLDAVSIVVKCCYLYCFIDRPHVCFACHEVLCVIVLKYCDRSHVCLACCEVLCVKTE